VRRRFLSLYEEGAAGKLAQWKSTSAIACADRAARSVPPRNMFPRHAARVCPPTRRRSTRRANAVEQGYDRSMRPVERMFVYLPFEHAEVARSAAPGL